MTYLLDTHRVPVDVLVDRVVAITRPRPDIPVILAAALRVNHPESNERGDPSGHHRDRAEVYTDGMQNSVMKALKLSTGSA